MIHQLLFAYHVVRALGLLRGLAALMMEWARPYHSVHVRYPDGSHGPWEDGFRAWRWTRRAVADAHVALRRPLDRAFNCLLPADFPVTSPMRLTRRATSSPRITTLWGGRNLLAEQLMNSALAASECEECDIGIELEWIERREEHAATLQPLPGYTLATSPLDARFLEDHRTDSAHVRPISGLYGIPVDYESAMLERARYGVERGRREVAILTDLYPGCSDPEYRAHRDGIVTWNERWMLSGFDPGGEDAFGADPAASIRRAQATIVGRAVRLQRIVRAARRHARAANGVSVP